MTTQTKTTKTKTNKTQTALQLSSFLMAAVLAIACQPNSLRPKQSLSSKTTALPSSTPSENFKITNVIIQSKSSGGTTSAGGQFNAQVYFDATKSDGYLTDYCNLTGDKPCACVFIWTEINQSSGNSVSVPRSAQTPVTRVQNSAVECLAPTPYGKNEIPNGTQIKISVVPAAGNGSSLSTNQYKYTKSSSGAATGSFQDAQGRFFDNILQYSCFEQFKRGTAIRSKRIKVSGTPTNIFFPMASSFCALKTDGSLVGEKDQCGHLPDADYSAQAYYYNLFIRESERGDINHGNDRYVCPLVDSGLPPPAGATGSTLQNQPYPLSSNFALSLGPTPEFNVAVEGFSKLSNGSDPVSQASACYGQAQKTETPGTTPSGTPVGGTLISSCLGFASKPANDGTCPTFMDSTGQLRHTYRLRRFVAIYPKIFETTGDIISGEPQATDVVYVLDRPVLTPAGADPTKPYTMRGPKPCPFAFYDYKTVVDTVKDYRDNNHPDLNDKNIDGIEFPNIDSLNSCSAAMPVVNNNRDGFSIATVHRTESEADFRHVYVRPIKRWSPHYEEDTEFRACAPLAAPFRDPPLHFARARDGNIHYCAENYPNYNSKVGRGTAHSVKKSSSSCANTNCRFTVTTPDLTWPNFPLLGTDYRSKKVPDPNFPNDATKDITLEWGIEAALKGDTSYGCRITYDAGQGKELTYTPKDGCCSTSSVQLATGFRSLTFDTNQDAAHLEPNQACGSPRY